MYAIARRLSLEARRETAAAFADWREAHPDSTRLITDACYCPLGYALVAMGRHAYHHALTANRSLAGAPSAYMVGDALAPGNDPLVNEIADEAVVFITRWDRNDIRDIYTALGVRKPKGDSPCSPATTPDPAP